MCEVKFLIDTGRKEIAFAQVNVGYEKYVNAYDVSNLLFACGFFDHRQKSHPVTYFRDQMLIVREKVKEFEPCSKFEKPILTKGLALTFLNKVIDRCEEHPKATASIF